MHNSGFQLSFYLVFILSVTNLCTKMSGNQLHQGWAKKKKFQSLPLSLSSASVYLMIFILRLFTIFHLQNFCSVQWDKKMIISSEYVRLQEEVVLLYFGHLFANAEENDQNLWKLGQESNWGRYWIDVLQYYCQTSLFKNNLYNITNPCLQSKCLL
jgi:hypothetical protein